jgi:hypothetical protein
MAKYKFIKEHTSTYRVWNPSIGTSSAVEQSITFKVGDIVDGTFVPAHQAGGGIMAPYQAPDSVTIPNPNVGQGLFNGNGAPTGFSIPPSELQLVSGSPTMGDSVITAPSGKRTTPTPEKSSTPTPNKSIFTPKNIIIGVLKKKNYLNCIKKFKY